MVTSSVPRPGGVKAGTIIAALVGSVSAGLVLLILSQFLFQVFHPRLTSPFIFVKDVPLPSSLPTRFIVGARDVPQQETPLTPGVSVPFDGFDFQALDPVTKLLFFAHPGPGTDVYAQFNPTFDADKDSQVDGYVGVIDTTRNVLVGRIDVPQVAGIVVAPDLGRVFMADANDGIIYSVNESLLKTTSDVQEKQATAIPLGTNDGPDAIEYDPDDHKVFVSDPGNPPASNPNGNVSLDNQAILVIDVLHNNVVSRINLGHQPKLPTEDAALSQFGYDVGHNHYDPVLRRIFVPTQQLTDQSVLNPATPPGGTGELEEINPVTQQIVARLQLPKTCGTPHGMNIDQQEQIAFIVCSDVDPDQSPQLTENLTRVNLRTMTNIAGPLEPLAPGPDIVIMDNPLHLVFVGCAGGVSVFDESNSQIRNLGEYIIGKGTHTIYVDEVTQDVYSSQVDVGGRPMMAIFHFDSAGITPPAH